MKAHQFRMNSVSESTLKARQMQWRAYTGACDLFGWDYLTCGVHQACKYVTYLSERLKFSSIVAYYQSVIFHHTCAGIEPVRISNSVLQSTLKGIKRLEHGKEKGKDPIFPHHLEMISNIVNFEVELEFLVFVASLLMFRTLLRVSHVINSEHTLKNAQMLNSMLLGHFCWCGLQRRVRKGKM